MKKYIFILLLTIGAMACNDTSAQSLIPLKTASGVLFDTISNTGSVTFVSAANALSANRTGSYALQFKATRVSGTQTYKAVIQGSLDGSNWTNINQVAGTTGIRTDSLQVTADTPSYWIFRISANASNNAGKLRYIRIFFKGDSTQKTRISDVYLIND